MIRKAVESDIDRIIAFLKEHLDHCVYLYIDISKYRLTNPNMMVWLDDDETDEIKAVVMKYHTSITFFTLDEDNLDGIVEIINEVKPYSVSSTRALIEKVMPQTSIRYQVSFGYVVRYTTFPDMGGSDMVEMATEDDMREIAELILSDEGIGSYYEMDDFENQLKERLRTGMGRNFIIRKDGIIIAHCAIYAELDYIAVGGGFIVHPDYRKDITYGLILDSYTFRKIVSENKLDYAFLNEKRMKTMVRLGNTCVGEYGKLFVSLDR